MTNSNVNSKRGGTVNLGSSLAAAATRQKDANEQQPQLTGKEAFRAEIAAELDARSEETAKLLEEKLAKITEKYEALVADANMRTAEATAMAQKATADLKQLNDNFLAFKQKTHAEFQEMRNNMQKSESLAADKLAQMKNNLTVIQQDNKALKASQDAVGESYMRAGELTGLTEQVKKLRDDHTSMAAKIKQQESQQQDLKAEAMKIAEADRQQAAAHNQIVLKMPESMDCNEAAVKSELENVSRKAGVQLQVKSIRQMGKQQGRNKTPEKKAAANTSTSTSTDSKQQPKLNKMAVEFENADQANKFLASKKHLSNGVYADNYLTPDERTQRVKLAKERQALKQNGVVVAWRRATLYQLNSDWHKKSKQAKWVPVSAETLSQVRAAVQTDKEKQK
jgi:hypothetical protein